MYVRLKENLVTSRAMRNLLNATRYTCCGANAAGGMSLYLAQSNVEKSDMFTFVSGVKISAGSNPPARHRCESTSYVCGFWCIFRKLGNLRVKIVSAIVETRLVRMPLACTLSNVYRAIHAESTHRF